MSISPVDTTNSPCAKLHTLPINTVSFSNGFWANRGPETMRVWIPLAHVEH